MLTSIDVRPPTRRRLLKFSLRAVLLAVTAICVFLAWAVPKAHEQAAIVATLEKAGATFRYYDERCVGPDGKTPLRWTATEWLRLLLLEKHPRDVQGFFASDDSQITDDDLASLRSLDRLGFIHLGGARKVTGTGLRQLAGHRQISIYIGVSGMTYKNYRWLKEVMPDLHVGDGLHWELLDFVVHPRAIFSDEELAMLKAERASVGLPAPASYDPPRQ